jgi:sec-independent protein translocase protein TatC
MTAHSEMIATIWDHLEDLRQTLLGIFLIIALGFLALMTVHGSFFQFITSSIRETSAHSSLYTKEELKVERVTNISQQAMTYSLPAHARLLSKDQLIEVGSNLYHLEVGQSLEYFLPTQPSLLWILNPIEGMLVTFKLCFWASVILTSPLWSYLLTRFILPGLKPMEKKLILPFLTGSFFSLGIGMTIAYTITLPLANQYLSNFNTGIGQNAWSLSYYVDYLMLLLLGHAVAFEMAFILLLMVHFRWISEETLIAKRRLMIVIAFIVGALLTPPDVVTQLILAFPLIIIYEIIILYAKMRNYRNKQLAGSVNF